MPWEGCPRGAPVGAVVLLVAVAGASDGEALKGPLIRGLPLKVIRPQNGFPLWDALQLAPEELQLHPPLFLLVEEA